MVLRYDGSELGKNPHLAIIGSSKVGNFIATLPLLNLLRKKYPTGTIDFWGSDVTRELEESFVGSHSHLIDWRISWDTPDPNTFQILAESAQLRGNPDLLINCDGFNPLAQVLASWLRPKYISGIGLSKNCRGFVDTGALPENKILAEDDWDSNRFLSKYEGTLNTNYIAEIFCRLAFLRPTLTDLQNIRLPSKHSDLDVPDILIHCSGSRSAKLWPSSRWEKVLEWCSNTNKTVGLIGASPKISSREYEGSKIETELVRLYSVENGGTLYDLRGKTTLKELVSLCIAAKGVISVDAGPMHIAASVNDHVLAVVGNDAAGTGASPIRLWLPRTESLKRTISSESCSSCEENRYSNNHCLRESHLCMQGVDADQVICWLEELFQLESDSP